MEREMDREEILNKVAEIAEEFLHLEEFPGIHRIILDGDKIYCTSTFSGDNSFVPGDTRIVLCESDVREYLSLETRGLDNEGNIIESSTIRCLQDEAEESLDWIESCL